MSKNIADHMEALRLIDGRGPKRGFISLEEKTFALKELARTIPILPPETFKEIFNRLENLVVDSDIDLFCAATDYFRKLVSTSMDAKQYIAARITGKLNVAYSPHGASVDPHWPILIYEISRSDDEFTRIAAENLFRDLKSNYMCNYMNHSKQSDALFTLIKVNPAANEYLLEQDLRYFPSISELLWWRERDRDKPPERSEQTAQEVQKLRQLLRKLSAG